MAQTCLVLSLGIQLSIKHLLVSLNISISDVSYHEFTGAELAASWVRRNSHEVYVLRILSNAFTCNSDSYILNFRMPFDQIRLENRPP